MAVAVMMTAVAVKMTAVAVKTTAVAVKKKSTVPAVRLEPCVSRTRQLYDNGSHSADMDIPWQ